MKELVVTALVFVGGYAALSYFAKNRNQQARFGLAQRGQTQSTIAKAPVGIPLYRLGVSPQLPQQVYAAQQTAPGQTSLPSGYAPAFGPRENATVMPQTT